MLLMITINQTALAEKSTAQIGDSYFNTIPKQSGKSKLAKNSRAQIGNSYFQTKSPKANDTLTPKTLSQVGATVEEHQTNAIFYGFINQLFTNHLYYELRAYASYHYISQNPPAPPLVPKVIPVSSEHNTIGYGGVGIFGYNIELTPDVSLLPYIRLQSLINTVAVYEDSFGNKINSVASAALLGSKLSLRVNEKFAIYMQYYAGYQYCTLSGRGLYSSNNHPTINALTSTVEFGTPYKTDKAVSITPYLQFITADSNPSLAARNKPYSISQLTNTNTVFAIKIGYGF